MFYQLKTLVVIEVLLLIGLFLFRSALTQRERAVVDTRTVGLMLLIPAVGLLSGNAYIYYGFLTLAVAVSSRTRAGMASTYILTLPMTPMLTIETTIIGIYFFALSTLTFMNLGALIGLAVTPRKGVAGEAKYDIAVLLLFALFVFIIARGSTASGYLRTFLAQGLVVLVPYLVISRSLATREDVERFLLRFLLGGVLVAVVAIFQASRHWVLYQAFYETLHVPLQTSATLSLRAGMLRTGGPMVDYTAGGLFLAAILVTLPAMRTKFRANWVWLIASIITGGLLASQSRGAWLAALVGFFFLLFLRGRIGWALTMAGIAVLAELTILANATTGRLGSVLGSSKEASGTVDYRKELLSRGLEEIAKHPFAGRPQRELAQSMADLVQGQNMVDFVNTHLFVALAAGVPLFVMWLLIWGLPVADAIGLRRAAPGSSRFAEVPAVIVVTVFTGLSATSLIDRNLTWGLIALGLTASCFRIARARERPAARTAKTRAPARLTSSPGTSGIAGGNGAAIRP